MASETPKKSTTSAYIIRDYGDDVQPRLEIRDLQSEHPKQFTLFIQAITNLKKPGYTYQGSTAPSWLELGGIHGKPYKQWSGDPNGAPGPVNENASNSQGAQWSGYCHHQSVLFPTWHRVVMLLVEQATCLEAKDIAKSYAAKCHQSNSIEAQKEAVEWETAAINLRFPFWDWLKPYDRESKIIFPPLLDKATTQVQVLEPLNPNPISVPNPLLRYHFEAIPPGFGPDDEEWRMNFFASWKSTYRWPAPNEPQDPTEQYGLLNQVWFDGLETFYAYNSGNTVSREPVPLTGDQTLQQKVGWLFTYPKPELIENIDPKYLNNVWDFFSNNGLLYGQNQEYHEAPCPSVLSTAIPSVEDSHDLVHLHVGGYGDMANCDYAAFDPIFFLHHCNVDRIWAFWEYVYPEYWIGQGYFVPGEGPNVGPTPWNAPLGAFSIEQHTIEHPTTYNQGSDLIPFRVTEDKYWNSQDIKGLQQRKYTYPPITRGQDSVDLLKPFNPQVRATDIAVLLQQFLGPFGDPLVIGDTKKAPLLKPDFFSKPPSGVPELPNGHVLVPNHRQFIIVVHLNRYVFRGPYNLELFLLDERRNYPVVQRVSVLTRKDAYQCEACVARINTGALSKGTMAIDSRLVWLILEWRQVNHEGASDDDVLSAIGSSLGARLVTAGRELLADTISDGNSTPLEPAKIPKMSLVSSHAIRQERSNTNLGLSFVGLTPHFNLPLGPDGKSNPSGWFKKTGPVPPVKRLPEDLA